MAIKKRTTDEYTRTWIKTNSYNVIQNYSPGELTLRGLHYQLVGLGMTNTVQHYKRVVAAMIEARREGNVPYGTFSDHDREVIGRTDYEETDLYTEIERGKRQIKSWMQNFNKNRWENQPYVVEIWIEKKALIGTFDRVCRRNRVALAPCKGYPSLTFLNDAADRFQEVENEGKTPLILYFGDYDPSGEDIPRSIQDNLGNDFGVYVEVRRVALMEDQVVAWKLPHAPVKEGDSRTANWGGLGQVELDAVEPRKLQGLVQDAIDTVFDKDIYEALLEQESEEKTVYVKQLRDYVIELGDDLTSENNE